MYYRLREFDEGDRPQCRRLLDNLPEWFGLETSNVAYIKMLGTIPNCIACDKDLAACQNPWDFQPLFESLELWGPDDAALIMLREIPPATASVD